jgi:hypothetical protein
MSKKNATLSGSKLAYLFFPIFVNFFRLFQKIVIFFKSISCNIPRSARLGYWCFTVQNLMFLVMCFCQTVCIHIPLCYNLIDTFHKWFAYILLLIFRQAHVMQSKYTYNRRDNMWYFYYEWRSEHNNPMAAMAAAIHQ